MLKILARQDTVPQLSGKVSPGGHAVTNGALAAVAPERQAQFALLQFPDAPVRLVEGSALVAGNEARAAHIEVRNLADKPLKYVELGWILTDPNGRDVHGVLDAFDGRLAAPAARRDRQRKPAEQPEFHGRRTAGAYSEDDRFRRQVEFADGKIWVPTRQNLDDTVLAKVLAPSAEEERLAALYLRKGVNALAEELRKF